MNTTKQDLGTASVAITARQMRAQRKLRRQERNERLRGYDLRKAKQIERTNYWKSVYQHRQKAIISST